MPVVTLPGVTAFAAYLGTGVLVWALALAAYALVTRHSEFAQIRKGNIAAAIAFGGWALIDRNEARDQATAANQVVDLLTAGDAQTASATSTVGGTATVIRSQSEGAALLVASGLPDPGDGKIYEAWTIKGQTPVPAGLFTHDEALGKDYTKGTGGRAT